MAGLSLQHIFKAYYFDGKEKRKAQKEGGEPYFLAVKDFNMEINDGEFVVFVGPSGCGKSTTLRMVAGLEEISQGELYIGDRLVNDVSPKDRDIAMVFQNYALYPHMTCYQNIAFALKLRKQELPVFELDPVIGEEKKAALDAAKAQLATATTPEEKAAAKEAVKVADKAYKDYLHFPTVPVMEVGEDGVEKQKTVFRKLNKYEIDVKVHAAAKILDIESQLDKKPGAMSGGQRQRVALGRAIVRDPKVFLLDEPLSNLDAKLRGQMRVEITKLHKQLGTTFIYVTHDQVEAMTMGDRIVVMKLGVVQQIDTPTNLFDYPANVFVAGFIGTPQMNFYRGTIRTEAKNVVLEFENGDVVKAPIAEFKKIKSEYLTPDPKDIVIGIRGDHIEEDDSSSIKASLTFVESLGLETNLYGEFQKPMGNYLEGGNSLVIKIAARSTHQAGDVVGLKFPVKHLHLFDAETEESIIIKPEGNTENAAVKESFKKQLEAKEAE